MLDTLLKYHQELISKEFVENILKRVEESYQTRHLILGVMGLIGMGLALFAFVSLSDNNWFMSITPLVFESKNLVYLGLLLMLTFIAGLLLFDTNEH